MMVVVANAAEDGTVAAAATRRATEAEWELEVYASFTPGATIALSGNGFSSAQATPEVASVAVANASAMKRIAAAS